MSERNQYDKDAEQDNGPYHLLHRPGPKPLKERIDLLATSYATDEDRLQILIHLVGELAELVLNPEGKTPIPDTAKEEIK